MFGWFKRLRGNREHQRFTGIDNIDICISPTNSERISIKNNQPLDIPVWVMTKNHTLCRYVSISNGSYVSVLPEHYEHACKLVDQIKRSKRQKKKHSHLLAELKALEVK